MPSERCASPEGSFPWRLLSPRPVAAIVSRASSMAGEARHDQKLKSQIRTGFSYSDLLASQFGNHIQSIESMELLHLPAEVLQQEERNALGSSSRAEAMESSGAYFHLPELQKAHFLSGYSPGENLLVAPQPPWPENRPPALSLTPGDTGLQSFEAVKDINYIHPQASSNFRDGSSGKVPDFHMPYLFEDRSAASGYHQHLKNSKFVIPVQHLLREFCNLGTEKRGDKAGGTKSKPISPRNHHSPYSLDLPALHRRKAKLVSMLQEVDRRYRRYYEQMAAVVAAFEAEAGRGAAAAYSSLASKAMSRHFRCLREGIVGQIQETKRAMGEKDPVVPGTSRGQTPRLKLLDQTMQQQRATQMGAMETHPWRPKRGLPERSVSCLRAWLFEHFLHPYPTDVDKHNLARQTGLSRSQVSNWFINARVRLWKPMVEEMYLEEAKEQDRPASAASHKKPQQEQHLRWESDSLFSIINHSEKLNPVKEAFNLVDLDFSPYSRESSAVTYANSEGGFGGVCSNGVSLKLGLQHPDAAAAGVGMAFSPAGSQRSLFSRQQMEECQLMGAQLLLQDMAG